MKRPHLSGCVSTDNGLSLCAKSSSRRVLTPNMKYPPEISIWSTWDWKDSVHSVNSRCCAGTLETGWRFFYFFKLIRPHCFKHSDRIQQKNLRPGNKTTGFRYWIETSVKQKKVKDVWKSKAACDKAGEGSKAGDPLPGERCAYVVELAFANNWKFSSHLDDSSIYAK